MKRHCKKSRERSHSKPAEGKKSKRECPIGSARDGATFRGRLLWFNSRTGAGCIVREDGAGDCFIDKTCLRPPFQVLRAGEDVQFEIHPQTKKAINIEVLKREKEYSAYPSKTE